jgi:hypothetical protein
MLLDDDVMADGEAKPSAFSGRFRCEERIEHLFFHVRRNAGAVVANPDFHAIAEAFGRGSEDWLVITAIGLLSASGRCIKTIGNQIEQNPRDVLREDVSLADGRIAE